LFLVERRILEIMKKTIAKLMAAAMMLSAVPAVTLPSFVSKAADAAVTNTTTNTYATQFAGGESKLAAATKGELFAFTLPSGRTLADYSVAGDSVNSAVATGLKVELKLDTNNLVHVVASMDHSKMTTTQKKDFMDAVKAGNNTFKVKLTKNYTAGTTLQNPNGRSYTFNGSADIAWNISKNKQVPLEFAGKSTGAPFDPADFNDADRMFIMFNQTISWVSDKTYTIGGVYENGKIKSGVADTDGYLQDRNVYAKLDKVINDELAEVELLKQDKNEANKLKNNDALRGQKLDLNTVWIAGVQYKVGKLGSQALKEAKMKKIELKNCSKVGKGAMRKCKQLRNVNLKDKNKVRKIHAKAFYDCKNLKNITIDARKLNTVGNESFTKVKKNCRIKLKASKSKYNDVVKKIKKANKKNTTLKFARIAP
jgi:hypothetical protein